MVLAAQESDIASRLDSQKWSVLCAAHQIGFISILKSIVDSHKIGAGDRATLQLLGTKPR